MARLSLIGVVMCDCCGKNSAVTSVSAMLMTGANPHSIRVAVCPDCREKARRRDFDTWQRIKAVAIACHDPQPSPPSMHSR
jgi:hypothetical protein